MLSSCSKLWRTEHPRLVLGACVIPLFLVRRTGGIRLFGPAFSSDNAGDGPKKKTPMCSMDLSYEGPCYAKATSYLAECSIPTIGSGPNPRMAASKYEEPADFYNTHTGCDRSPRTTVAMAVSSRQAVSSPVTYDDDSDWNDIDDGDDSDLDDAYLDAGKARLRGLEVAARRGNSSSSIRRPSTRCLPVPVPVSTDLLLPLAPIAGLPTTVTNTLGQLTVPASPATTYSKPGHLGSPSPAIMAGELIGNGYQAVYDDDCSVDSEWCTDSDSEYDFVAKLRAANLKKKARLDEESRECDECWRMSCEDRRSGGLRPQGSFFHYGRVSYPCCLECGVFFPPSGICNCSDDDLVMVGDPHGDTPPLLASCLGPAPVAISETLTSLISMPSVYDAPAPVATYHHLTSPVRTPCSLQLLAPMFLVVMGLLVNVWVFYPVTPVSPEAIPGTYVWYEEGVDWSRVRTHPSLYRRSLRRWSSVLPASLSRRLERLSRYEAGKVRTRRKRVSSTRTQTKSDARMSLPGSLDVAALTNALIQGGVNFSHIRVVATKKRGPLRFNHLPKWKKGKDLFPLPSLVMLSHFFFDD